jgi:hypothetical protein
MLLAATQGNWDELVKLERQRTQHIESIKQEDPDPRPMDAQSGRKREIAMTILRTDEQIQVLTQDWMHELRQVLSSVHTEQRLNRAYEP